MSAKDKAAENKNWNMTEREMFLRYTDTMRQCNDASFELSKQMYEIDLYEREHYKKELERQKSYINDLLDIAKFIIKLSATALVASFAPIDNFVDRGVVFGISAILLASGIGGMVTLLDKRSKIEVEYINDMNSIGGTAQNYRDAVLARSKLLSKELRLISEMIKKEMGS